MKQLNVLAFLVIGTLGSLMAQEQNYLLHHNGQFVGEYPMAYTPESSVKAVRFQDQNRKGNTKTIVKHFTEEGALLSIEVSDKNGTLQPWAEYEYNSDGKETHFVMHDNKKLARDVKTEYNAEGKPVLQEWKNHAGKVKAKNTWTYNEANQMLASKRFGKSGKLQKEWKYLYNADGEKERSQLYSGKGKLKHEWSFDCKQEGEKLEKKAEETQVCTWTESEDNYLVRVNQSFDERGKITRTVSKFTMQDTLPVSFTAYNKNDEPYLKMTYDLDYHKPLVRESYFKGKLAWKTEHTYVEGRLATVSSYKKDKLRYQEKLTYEEGQLAGLQRTNGKGEVVRKVTLEHL